MKTFSEMGLPESLRHTLTHLNFVAPTPIQAKAIPIALKGNDILGSAQTGTGKTVAFAIPLIVNLYNKQNNTALVMTPTRELASQVMSQFASLLGKKTKIRKKPIKKTREINLYSPEYLQKKHGISLDNVETNKKQMAKTPQ